MLDLLGRRGLHVTRHDELLDDLNGDVDPSLRVDSVIVPATRDPLTLQTAVKLARGSADRLIVLCSQGCRVDEAAKAIEEKDPLVDVLLIDVENYRLPFGFGADAIAQHHSPRSADTALKRNLGLLLSKALGDSLALFVDDDVRFNQVGEVARAAQALTNGAAAAGWSFGGFPDNSVFCHALRLLHKPRQGVFLGGGGLGVRVDQAVPFFPSVYNEDWLFMAPLLAEHTVTNLGSLQQTRFNPFLSPERAGREEWGDILAEGLFYLIRKHRTAYLNAVSDEAYWQSFIQYRKKLARIMLERLARIRLQPRMAAKFTALAARHEYATPGDVYDSIEASLRASLESQEKAGAVDFVEWVGAWQQDLATWREQCKTLVAAVRDEPAAGRLAAAITYLDGLAPRATTCLPLLERVVFLEGRGHGATVEARAPMTRVHEALKPAGKPLFRQRHLVPA